MTAYLLVLFLHSWLRWFVVAAGLALLVVSLRGLRNGRAWGPAAERVQVAFVALVDMQLLLGLTLFLELSPLARALRADMAHAVHVHTVRFFGLEHPVTMLVAVALVHVGRVRSRRAAAPALRYRRAVTWTVVALLLFAAGMPWPGLRHGRPLARGWGEPGGDAAASTPRIAVCPPLYAGECAACHGAHGRGDGVTAAALNPPPRDFTSATVAARTDAELGAVIRDGGGRHGLSAAMPPHATLSDADIAALVACVRGFRRDAAP